MVILVHIFPHGFFSCSVSCSPRSQQLITIPLLPLVMIVKNVKMQRLYENGLETKDMQRMRQSIHNYLCVCVCVCVHCYCMPSLASMPQVSPHAGHSRHSRASVRLYHGNTNHTPFTPLFEARKHGNLGGNVCVRVCGRERTSLASRGTKICGCC